MSEPNTGDRLLCERVTCRRYSCSLWGRMQEVWPNLHLARQEPIFAGAGILGGFSVDVDCHPDLESAAMCLL